MLAGASLLVPRFLRAAETLPLNTGDRKLIVIQLSGGNDGLNTLIPYRNDLYHAARPSLAYTQNEVLRLNDEAGLNPAMSQIQRLYDNGDISIINSVGYPDPDRSHFRSMDIWHTASASNEYLNTGWLGRYLDATCRDCQEAHMVLETDDMLSLALKGERINGMAVKNPERLWRAAHEPFFEGLLKTKTDSHHHELAGYLYRTALQTTRSVDYLAETFRKAQTKASYPDHEFGNHLKLIAGLIGAGCETRVYYASLSGFDTHARQKQVQERLLKTLSEGMSALISDLKQTGNFNNTLIMVFSEFGRRVKENGSGGTDHGAGNMLMFAGGGLKKKGFYNPQADLSKLSSGDIAYQIDFRDVYYSVLEDWMQTPAGPVVRAKKMPASIF